MHAALGGKAEAVRVDHPVPKGWVGRLLGVQLHRYIGALVILAFVCESLLVQAGADHLQGFFKHRPRVQKRHLKICLLKRGHTPSDPDFQAAIAHMIEHANFTDQSQRMIQRQQIHQRPQTNAFGMLDGRSEEDPRRRRHAQRRGVVFGQMVAVKAGFISHLEESQAPVIQLTQRVRSAFQVIKNSKIYSAHDCSFVPLNPLAHPR